MPFVTTKLIPAGPAPSGPALPESVAATLRSDSRVTLPTRRPRPVTSRLLGHTVLAALSLISILPIYWMLATAFRAPDDALSNSPIPWPLSTANFEYIFSAIPIMQMIGNTLLMAALLTVAQLLVAIFASYAFTMWEFVGKKFLYLLFVGSWLVPFQVTMIPNYVLVSQLGLLNTIAGVVLPNLCSAFGVLLLRQHMQAFPRDLIDASKIDGRTSWGTLWLVLIPNMRPALASLSIMLFISAWNEYLWPMLIMPQSDSLIQVGIRSFLGEEGNNWGALMAASGLACLPIFAIYILLQRHVIDGFVRSGIK